METLESLPEKQFGFCKSFHHTERQTHAGVPQGSVMVPVPISHLTPHYVSFSDDIVLL